MRILKERGRRALLLLICMIIFITGFSWMEQDLPEEEPPEPPSMDFSLEGASDLPMPSISIAFLDEESEEPVSRGSFIAALGTLAGLNPGRGRGGYFLDVKSWDDRAPWFGWAADQGIMYPAGRFRFAPDEPLTMQEAALVLDRFAKATSLVLPEGKGKEIQDAASVADYAREAVDRFLDAGVLRPYRGEKLCPGEALPQKEAARILLRLSMVPDFAGRVLQTDQKGSSLADLVPLYDLLQEETESVRGTWSVYVHCMETDEELVYNDRKLCSASLIKLYVAGACLEAVRKGDLEDSDTLASNLARMISYSSNTGWERLEEALGEGDQEKGIEAVNAFIGSLGLTMTERRHYYEEDEEDTGYTNYTSAAETGRVLTAIADRTYVSREASDRIYDLMLDQANRSKIPRGLPYSAVCANKTGELSDVQNDAAIIRGDTCTYVLVVMSEGNRTQRAGIREIGRISEMVYDFLNEE